MSLHVMKDGVSKKIHSFDTKIDGSAKAVKEFYGVADGVSKPVFNFFDNSDVSSISIKWGNAAVQTLTTSKEWIYNRTKLQEWADLTINSSSIIVNQKVENSIVYVYPYLYVNMVDGRSFRMAGAEIRELVRDNFVWSCRSCTRELVSGSGYSSYTYVSYRKNNSYTSSASLLIAGRYYDGPLSPIYSTSTAYGEILLQVGTYFGNGVRQQLEVQFNNPTWAGRTIPIITDTFYI